MTSSGSNLYEKKVTRSTFQMPSNEIVIEIYMKTYLPTLFVILQNSSEGKAVSRKERSSNYVSVRVPSARHAEFIDSVCLEFSDLIVEHAFSNGKKDNGHIFLVFAREYCAGELQDLYSYYWGFVRNLKSRFIGIQVGEKSKFRSVTTTNKFHAWNYAPEVRYCAPPETWCHDPYEHPVSECLYEISFNY